MKGPERYALSSCIASAFALDALAGGSDIPGQASLYEYLTKIIRIIKSNTENPMMLVIDDLEYLFDNEGPIESYSDIPDVFSWLLQSEIDGDLAVILSTSSKSVLKVLQQCKGYDRLLFKSLDAVNDEQIIDYLLNQINDVIIENKFSRITAELFVQTFGGNLQELDQYCKSSLTVSGKTN